MENEVNFVHIRNTDSAGRPYNKGGATAAFRLGPLTADGRTLEVGFSFCSDNDNFCKARGRIMAAGRMNGSPGSLNRHSVILPTNVDRKTLIEAVKALLKEERSLLKEARSKR